MSRPPETIQRALDLDEFVCIAVMDRFTLAFGVLVLRQEQTDHLGCCRNSETVENSAYATLVGDAGSVLRVLNKPGTFSSQEDISSSRPTVHSVPFPNPASPAARQ